MVEEKHGMAMARGAATALIIDIYDATRCFPTEEAFGLTLRFRKSIIDVAALVSVKSFEVTPLVFLDIIRRSLERLKHLKACITESRSRGLLSNASAAGFARECKRIELYLNAAMAGLTN